MAVTRTHLTINVPLFSVCFHDAMRDMTEMNWVREGDTELRSWVSSRKERWLEQTQLASI